ncbi:MAG: hypothetical protein EU532_09590 [Promethearchaeota archaeon]|nr:MAG: hypothetical protein EU532_09590 [Candidatus Lokiarchaeota archaeon]
MELTPDKIYEEYKKNNIDKVSASELLFSLIDNSDKDTIRVESIKELANIRATDNKTFKQLEHLLISDLSETVRSTAAIILKNLFLEKSLEPMKWALKHEISPSCLKIIYATLCQIIENITKKEGSLSKIILLTEVKKIENKEFKIGFEIESEKRGVENITLHELAEILINYFTLLFLEKTYWRIKVKIEHCKIIELDFIFKGLTKLPDALENLTHLKKIVFRYNQLFNLPDWIGSLIFLEELNLNVNNLKKLPNTIGSLSSLKNLSLWKNEIDFIPDSIGSLKCLEYLNLRINDLKELPDTIGNLSQLKELNLHDNKLEKLPITIGHLSSLEKLNLSWNSLENIPESIGSLRLLQILDLERNELKSIPPSIGFLNSLEILNISDNKLENLPDTLGSLASLQILNISRNHIKNLPKSLINLSNLKEIYVGDNKLINSSNLIEKLEHNGVQIYD